MDRYTTPLFGVDVEDGNKDKDPDTGDSHLGPAGEGVRHRLLHRPGKAVYQHPGTAPGTAAAVHPEDRGP